MEVRRREVRVAKAGTGTEAGVLEAAEVQAQAE